jgi:hypothetical protein
MVMGPAPQSPEPSSLPPPDPLPLRLIGAPSLDIPFSEKLLNHTMSRNKAHLAITFDTAITHAQCGV